MIDMRKMNAKQKQQKENELLQLIQPDCRHGNKEGYVKPQVANTLSHEVTKFKVVYWLRKNGYKVYTESAFTNKKGRADITAIQNGQGYAIEILCSESDERYLTKMDTYPKEFTLVKVRCDEFDFDNFCL
jgi:hypothetical protein